MNTFELLPSELKIFMLLIPSNHEGLWFWRYLILTVFSFEMLISKGFRFKSKSWIPLDFESLYFWKHSFRRLTYKGVHIKISLVKEILDSEGIHFEGIFWRNSLWYNSFWRCSFWRDFLKGFICWKDSGIFSEGVHFGGIF